METKEYLKKYGVIKNFNLADEFLSSSKIPKTNPSMRIFQTSKGKKTLKGLEDIENNHNNSWYKEIENIAKNIPLKEALFYRTNSITFKEMLENADKIYNSMLKAGIKKGDEIPICMSNTPELVYVLLAANRIGAKVNLFGDHLNKEYMINVLSNCTEKVLFATDDLYMNIKNEVEKVGFDFKVISSLNDSIPLNYKEMPEYVARLEKYYHYDNHVSEYKNQDSSIYSYDEFVEYGKDNSILAEDNNDLNTEFLVTYTSGSTKIGFPKQIVHTNRSLIVSGIFHSPELSGNPEMEKFRGLAHIHAESNTNIITSISDSLMQKWSVALEPEYDKKKALDYIVMNKPNFACLTTSFLVEMSKQYLYEKKFHEDGYGEKMGYLFAVVAVGEGTSLGEEKLINKFLRVSKAGCDVRVKGLKMPLITLSVGGGDCEHGGLYYTLWKSLYEKFNIMRLKQKEFGLIPQNFVQVSAFKKNENGIYEECKYNEFGVIAANSAITFSRYKNNEQETEKIIITDNYGRDWISTNVYGYIDELGGVHVKSRLGNEIRFLNGTSMPPFMLEDIISKDTKNILSCSIVNCENDVVANIEFQPETKKSTDEILKSVRNRLLKKYPREIVDNINYRIIDNLNSFDLSGSGKRSIPALEKMTLENTYSFDINKNIKLNTIDNKVFQKQM